MGNGRVEPTVPVASGRLGICILFHIAVFYFIALIFSFLSLMVGC